jgi:hypothetical protein
MKHIFFLAFIGLASSAGAQAPKEPAKEAAKPAAVQEPMKEAAKPSPSKQAAGPRKPRRWNEDARHCLERASNTEIIKCAEEFL